MHMNARMQGRFCKPVNLTPVKQPAESFRSYVAGSPHWTHFELLRLSIRPVWSV